MNFGNTVRYIIVNTMTLYILFSLYYPSRKPLPNVVGFSFFETLAVHVLVP